MDNQRIGGIQETTTCCRNLWRAMASDSVLKNLKTIIKFLQSPIDEVCFVNMQEKYLPFYYMIVLDEEFLQTIFLTHECKVATHEILRTLEAKRNSFTWGVSFSRQIVGMPIVFKKVNTQPCQVQSREWCEISSEFKETWIKTTLKFIKSSKLVLKYPEMPQREALYIYKGILKLNDEVFGLDSLWLPVWEALKIFKLRYEYIVSIHSTNFDYLKFVQFEKVKRKSCAIEAINTNSQWDIHNLKSIITGDTDDVKNKVTRNYRVANECFQKLPVLPDVNHEELIKILLENNVTKFGTVIYTLKVNGYNMILKSLNEKLDKVNTSFWKNIPLLLENETVELVTSKSNDEIVDISLSAVIQGEGKMKNIQQMNLNEVANANKEGTPLQTIMLIDNLRNCQDKTISNNIDIFRHHNSDENKDTDIIPSENIVEQAIQLLGSTVNKYTIKDVNANDATFATPPAANELSYKNQDSHLIDPNTVIVEIGISDKTESVNENPFFQQISKLQKQNRPLYVKEEFWLLDDGNETDYTTNDFVLINKMQSINCNINSSQYSDKNKKKKIKPPLSAKAQRRREARMKSRHDHKILRKHRLINTVPATFILKSFKAILDFINDDLRLSMEMVSLNIHEFNVLRQLYAFSPDVIPVEMVFHQSCWDLARDIFNRLKEKNEVLDINCVIPHEAESNTSGDPTRRRSVRYRKTALKKSRNFKYSSQNNANPESIFEKMCLMPITTEVLPERRQESPGRRGSQSRSVSPPQRKLVPTGQRPLAVNLPGNLTTKMKAKMLEKLAVPLESDKAMRMMRLMGWKGGALGVREGGLIEPIQPQLDVAKGVGLGYETFKSTNVCIKKLKTKCKDKKCVSEQKTQNIKVDHKKSGNVFENIESDISIDNKNNVDNSVADVEVFDTSTSPNKPNFISYTNVDNTKDPLIHVRNNVVETQNNTSEVVSMSDKDADAWTIKSSIENNTPINTCEDTIEKPKLEADFIGKMEDSSWLTNENLLEKIRNISALSTKTKEHVKDKSIDLKKKKNNWQMTNEDIKVQSYSLYLSRGSTHEALWLSNRTQFLVHLLALLQSDKKIFTVVSYVRKLKKECVGFIDSIIGSLNRLIEPTPIPLPSESRIVDACFREMEAHAQINLSYRIQKRLLVLEKSNDFSNIKSKPANLVEYNFDITHSVNDLYCHMPQGKEDIKQSKIITNRIILEFVKSNDRERVYDYGKSSYVIRWYIISLISLLNRQITEYDIELGNSEHSIFKEIRNSMKNFCLIFRFNTQKMFFTKLQLVKVDLTKRCHNCHLANKLVDDVDQTVNLHINGMGKDNIDISSNQLGINKDAELSKNYKNVTVDKINNEIICDRTVYAKDCTDKLQASKDYILNGEPMLVNKVNEETVIKNESGHDTNLLAASKFTKCIEIHTFQNNASANERNSNKYTINNDKKENVAADEIYSNFHNWPKRIKRSESNDSHLTNDNIQWNTAENYKGNFRNILKRKIINFEQKTVKNATKKVNIFIDNTVNSDYTVVENRKDINRQINTEERCTNIAKDCIEMKINADVITSEISNEENTGDKTLDIIKPIAGEKSIINDSDTLNIKAIDGIYGDIWPKKILVVHYKYPEHEIDATSVISLQSLLYDAIIADQYLPRLKCNGLKKGGIVYTCYDYSSYVWLFKHLQWYTLLDYEDTSDNSHLIQMKINTFIKVDTDVMFKNIEGLYGDIKTNSWKVLQIKYLTDYCVLSVEVDDSSMDAIKKEDYSLFVGIDKADISLVYDKVK